MSSQTPGVNAPNPYPSGTEPGYAGTQAALGGQSQAQIGQAAAGEAQSQSQAAPENVQSHASGGLFDPLGRLSDLINGLRDTVFSQGFWKRTGVVIAGVALIWVGVLIMIQSNKTVRTVEVGAAKDAAKAAVVA